MLTKQSNSVRGTVCIGPLDRWGLTEARGNCECNALEIDARQIQQV